MQHPGAQSHCRPHPVAFAKQTSGVERPSPAILFPGLPTHHPMCNPFPRDPPPQLLACFHPFLVSAQTGGDCAPSIQIPTFVTTPRLDHQSRDEPRHRAALPPWQPLRRRRLEIEYPFPVYNSRRHGACKATVQEPLDSILLTVPNPADRYPSRTVPGLRWGKRTL